MKRLLHRRVLEPHHLVPMRKLGPESHSVARPFEGLGVQLLEIRELSLLLRQDSAEVAARKKHADCFEDARLKTVVLGHPQFQCRLLRVKAR